MYNPKGMKARVSPVQSIEPHRILAPTRDSNQEPPDPESRVVITILPLHTDYQTKNRLQNLPSHIQNTCKLTTYIHIFTIPCLSFPTNSVSTRSSDSLVFSILFVRSSLGRRAFSVIGSRLWNSLHLIPETRLLANNSVPSSKHTFSKLRSLPRLFPISLDCLPWISILDILIFYALSTDTWDFQGCQHRSSRLNSSLV